ncbi:hypothetical protein CDD83_1945 [Cordyceps sp. RAO-2017]|nr:hypothetical protein CDD83_1945 [Cordyceps sp. RAO-2017]
MKLYRERVLGLPPLAFPLVKPRLARRTASITITAPLAPPATPLSSRALNFLPLPAVLPIISSAPLAASSSPKTLHSLPRRGDGQKASNPPLGAQQGRDSGPRATTTTPAGTRQARRASQARARRQGVLYDAYTFTTISLETLALVRNVCPSLLRHLRLQRTSLWRRARNSGGRRTVSVPSFGRASGEDSAPVRYSDTDYSRENQATVTKRRG